MDQSKQVFYTYDQRLAKFHRSFKDENGNFYNCPEVPDRVERIYEYLKYEGLLEHMVKLELDESKLEWIEKSVLILCHSSDYIK
jgi:acetoin utilization deacetylase AcuC-like enzyme